MPQEEFLPKRSIPTEVGRKLITVADQVLAETLQREPTPQELGELAQTMVSELASAGYVILREKANAGEAEKWLRMTLSTTAAAIRLRGSDALVKIDLAIRDVPNKMAQKAPVEPAMQLQKDLAPNMPCDCEKDGEGRCRACPQKLAKVFQDFFGTFAKMGAFANHLKGSCKACQRDHLDYAVSTIVDRLFDASPFEPEQKAAFAQETLGLLYQMATSTGQIKEMPLTVEAWKKAVERQGLSLEQQA